VVVLLLRGDWGVEMAAVGTVAGELAMVHVTRRYREIRHTTHRDMDGWREIGVELRVVVRV
jgi:hypothetical protein